MPELYTLQVAVQLPAHSPLQGTLDYVSEQKLAPGTLVRVPLGSRQVPGMVWSCCATQLDEIAPQRPLKPIAEVLHAVPALQA
jgi:primosomal protein N' (replication factor Y) (superfamily II helicase)